MRKIEEWLIILYFFVCPIELILNIAITSSTKYIGILIFLVSLINIFSNPEITLNLSNSIKSLIVWLAFCVISLAWCNNSERTFDFLTNYLEMGLLVFLLVQEDWSEKDINHFLFAYYLGSICLAIATNALGEVKYLGRSTIVFMGKTIDPNQLPANIIPGAIISLGYTINSQIKLRYRIITALTFLFMVYTVFLTGSRGALLGICGGMFLTYFLQSSGISINKIVCIGFSVILIWFALQLLPSETTDRILGFDSYTDTYSNGENRITIWKSLLDDFDLQWTIGHGVGSTISYFQMLVGKLRSVHNTFLLVLYEVGFIGFIFFIFPYISILCYNIRKRNNVLASILLAALITSFFLDSLNLRYIWNGLILCLMKYNCSTQPMKLEQQTEQSQTCKYIRDSIKSQTGNGYLYLK